MDRLDTYFFRIMMLLYMNVITTQVLASQGLEDIAIFVSKMSGWVITIFFVLRYVDKWIDGTSEENKEEVEQCEVQ